MSIVARQITYTHPDNEVLFKQIDLAVNKGEKIALVGDNGSGKSTLLRILARQIKPQEGEVIATESSIYYIPQHFGQYDRLTVAQSLLVSDKIKALASILEGDATSENFDALNDDWTIQERCEAALSAWGLGSISLNQPMDTLSGGEKTKVFLAGLSIHAPSVILMDEPTNHLDAQSRKKLYEFIRLASESIIVVSHDRTLLNLIPRIAELSRTGLVFYSGNYDFYKEQKELEDKAQQQRLEEKKKELRLAEKTIRQTVERKQKHESRGKKSNEKKGIPRIAMGTLKDQAEKSASKLQDIHHEKIECITQSIGHLRSEITDTQSMRLNFNSPSLHQGKTLIKAQDIRLTYLPAKDLWPLPLNISIRSGERIAIRGNNGSGKTSLLKLLVGLREPTEGRIERADFSYAYIDQDYSIIQDHLTVYGQAEQYNKRHFPEHHIKMILNRFLFPPSTWDKNGSSLSGGERMRLVLCCLMISEQTPDLFVLDEPTNNLDIRSTGIITSAMKEYKGTLLVVSHDMFFLNEIGINRFIECTTG